MTAWVAVIAGALAAGIVWYFVSVSNEIDELRKGDTRSDVLGRLARMERYRLDPPPPTPPIDTGEVCRTCIIEHDAADTTDQIDTLAADDCWEWGQELPNEPEMGTTGGSWVSGYWCTRHKPEGAWPWAP